MNRCPITYHLCGTEKYSKEGLRYLSARLENLNDFPFGEEEQFELALKYADKLSFSGVQKKINARLNVSQGVFEAVPHRGDYIIKPQSSEYAELPQNEDLTMKLAGCVGIDTPVHGLMYCKDGKVSYFIKRFDRKAKGEKIATEDFAQLAGLSRETKYDFSMERLVPLVEQWCTFPAIEKKKLFLLTLFSFLIGNEDLHLKNFSMIRHGAITSFSPAYDLVNSSIVMKTKEELALPLRGKKSRLTREDLVDYYGMEKLKLPLSVIDETLKKIADSMDRWKELIRNSFLSDEKKGAYLKLLEERKFRLLEPIHNIGSKI